MQKIRNWVKALLCLIAVTGFVGCAQEATFVEESETLSADSRATFVEGEKFTDWYNGYSTGNFSSDYYSTEGGDWEIYLDGSNYKLKENSGSSTAFIYQNDIVADDVVMSAKVKSQSSSNDAGIVAKYKDDNNYYTLFLDDGKIKLKKKVNGSWTTLDDASFSFSTSTTYKLGLDISGSSIKGYINDTLYVTGSDSSLDAGYFGMKTYKNKAIFDAFQIYYSGDVVEVPESDTTAPGNVSNLSVSAGDGEVTLSWSNPSDSDFASNTITASPGSYTTTLTGTSKTITGLTNNTEYTFTFKAKDETGNVSSGVTIKSTPEADTVVVDPIEPPIGDADYPSDLMRNYEQWKITYPDGVEDKTLYQESNEYFYVNENNNAIVFKAPIRSDNGTTPNSSYVRSELRERTEDGGSDIYWTTSGKHIVYVMQAITHLPTVKNHLVATQIHGNKDDGIDDAMVLRLEGEHLFLSFNGEKLRDDFTIKTDYKLGSIHEVIFEVVDGKHYVYYSEDGNLGDAYLAGIADSYLVKDGSNDYVMDLDYDQSYFKIGNYTQSNAEKEGDETDKADNYGEVVVYDFWVVHK